MANRPRATPKKQLPLRALGAVAVLTLATGTLNGATQSESRHRAADNAGSDHCQGRGIPANKISIQMFSYSNWGNVIGTEKIFAELAAIGYENVEPFDGSYEGRTAKEFSELLERHGLNAPTAHGSTDEKTFAETIDFAKTVGQRYTGSGGSASPGTATLRDTLETARTLNRLGEKSKNSGTGKIFVHNHQGEFTRQFPHPRTGELTSAWELLAEFTDPRYVTFELDVLWAADAGVDVVQLLSEYGERVELLHVKDGFLNGDERAVPTDLGEGELEWTPILDAAQKQVKYFIVERDLAPSTAEFARDSFEFLSCYTC